MSIFLSLKTQYENLGDEVINAMMLREMCKRTNVIGLSDRVPDWYISNLKDALGPLKEKLLLTNYPSTFLFKMVINSFSRDASQFYISCGHITGANCTKGRDIALEALQYMPNLKLGMVGVSYSEISESRARLLHIASKRLSALAVRDLRTHLLLKSRGVRVPVVPDLAFLLPTTSPQAADHSRNLLLIMLRETPNSSYEQTINMIKDIISEITGTGITAAIAWQVSRDEAFGRRIAQETSLPIVTPRDQKIGRFSAMSSIFKRTAFIISNRLHGLLIAASLGAVPIAMLDVEEVKVRSIFEDTGLADLIISTNAMSLTSAQIQSVLQSDWRRIGDIFERESARISVFFDKSIGPSATFKCHCYAHDCDFDPK